VQTAGQLLESYQYGPDLAQPAVADHTDASEPIWRRMFFGPQTWPDERALPEFRGAIENLCESYLELHHALGSIICEILGAKEGAYDELFDREHPVPLASLTHSYSLSHVRRGVVAKNRKARAGDEGVGRMRKAIARGSGAHVDITPFMALLTMDTLGLQVRAKGGEWVDMPVIPGAVCVNAGSTLQHLSGGRMVATVHRVNTALIPEGTTRMSCPFFLMPRFEVRNGVVNIITRTSHYDSFTMSSTGYILNDRVSSCRST
jgi:isopenicillin N synthase-like dioxygenase